MVIGSRTSRDGCVLSAYAIFINNASLWKNLASHTFVFLNVRLCLHIQKCFFAYDNLQI